MPLRCGVDWKSFQTAVPRLRSSARGVLMQSHKTKKNEGLGSPYRLIHRGRRAACSVALGLWIIGMATAETTSLDDLTQASLEDLMNMQVTSVSKKEQPLSKAPSAIYVITQSDIRHSGATNIPDLLRMVPGVEVARINANAWAITIRGFNYRYSGKVLVLIDGRTVYSPAFAGVYWDQQNIPLENIERIEVIRGPGGTVWGANAMNGVINIITKTSAETKGGVVSAVAGSYEGQALVQYGGTVGDGSYRVYGRYTMNGNSPSLPGNPAVDDGHSSQAGFRSDWKLSPADNLTVQGDLMGNSEGQTITTLFDNRLPNLYTVDDQVRVGAGNLLGRWEHVFSNDSEASVQLYYDRFRRFDQALNVENTGDAEFQYHFHVGSRNDIVAGLDTRVSDQVYRDGYEAAFGTGHRRDHLFSTFVQDEFRLTHSLSATAGVKLENNSYTGFEYEPSAQLVWSPAARHTFWASVAKAIEQPSWLFAQAQFDIASVPLPPAGFGIIHLSGDPNVRSQTMLNYELGYRTRISDRFSLDTSVFYSRYDHLPTLEPQAPHFAVTPAPPHLVIPSGYEAYGNANNFGLEFHGRWNVTRWWTLSPGFSYLHMHLFLEPGSQDTLFTASAGDSPKFQWQLRSEVRLPHRLEWDAAAYYVDSLIDGTLGTGAVGAYTRVDTRIGRPIGERGEISIGGQNLLRARHLEFLDGLQVTPMDTGRAVVAKILWRF